jgi:hypothetical protein
MFHASALAVDSSEEAVEGGPQNLIETPRASSPSTRRARLGKHADQPPSYGLRSINMHGGPILLSKQCFLLYLLTFDSSNDKGAAMKLVEITPRQRTRLYSALIKKEADIRGRGRGTFFRVGRKAQNSARWKHKKFSGSIDLGRGLSDLVTAKIRSSQSESERRLLASFLGFVDRHCGDDVSTIMIHYK